MTSNDNTFENWSDTGLSIEQKVVNEEIGSFYDLVEKINFEIVVGASINGKHQAFCLDPSILALEIVA